VKTGAKNAKKSCADVSRELLYNIKSRAFVPEGASAGEGVTNDGMTVWLDTLLNEYYTLY
jgi:hypothetical protein